MSYDKILTVSMRPPVKAVLDALRERLADTVEQRTGQRPKLSNSRVLRTLLHHGDVSGKALDYVMGERYRRDMPAPVQVHARVDDDALRALESTRCQCTATLNVEVSMPRAVAALILTAAGKQGIPWPVEEKIERDGELARALEV